MRYAVYYTPRAQSALSKSVASWLGRDAFEDVEVETSHGLDAYVVSPRRYGFHGTLKAPFRLADAVEEKDLLELFESFCAGQSAFTLPKITLGKLGSFFALVPAEPDEALSALASDVVKAFEPMRAALTHGEIERRNPDRLTPRQREHLMRWGYPYVMDEFRFHLTLSDAVPTNKSDEMEAALRHHFAEFIDQPLQIDTLGLFVETAPNTPFTVHRIADLNASNLV